MRKVKIFLFCCLSLIVVGCTHNNVENTSYNEEENASYNIVIKNSLPVEIKTISLSEGNEEQVLFAQDIKYGESASFTLDGDLREFIAKITPKDMYSTSVDVEIEDEDADIIEYEVILQKNELKLVKAN